MTTKSTPAAKAKAEPKSADGQPYATQAAQLADDTRALAESIREDLDKLSERVHDLGNPENLDVSDGPTADGVRRIPMAIDEVIRTVQALVLTAADLSRQATS